MTRKKKPRKKATRKRVPRKKKPTLPAFVGTVAGEKAAAFEYIKGNFHRVLHVNGVHGGPNPRGEFVMNVYSERYAIPKRVVHALVPHDKQSTLIVAGELERTELPAIVREVDASLVMSPAAAESIGRWIFERLGKKITVTPASHTNADSK